MRYLRAWTKWEKPGDPHLINRIQWDENELERMILPFNQDWHGYGHAQQQLETKLQTYTGIPHINLTNSGSTAIATGLKALRENGRFSPGDFILHPVTTFPTSISSAIDYGGIPVYIETKLGTYVVDETQVERAIQRYPGIAGMILPHLLGNIPNMHRIKEALGDRWLIEDSCDTMGGVFDGKQVGNFGDFAAFSFYGSHHMTTAGVGGAIGTGNLDLHKLARSIIFWGHDYNAHSNSEPNSSFLTRYATQTIGNDFQMSGIQAGFGLAQIEKLPHFVEARNRQFKEIDSIFEQRGKDYFVLPQSDPLSSPSWFSYPLMVKDSAPFTRDELVAYLASHNVEIRPIMCGNLLRQLPFAKTKRITLDEDHFPIGDQIERTGLFIPAWGMPENQKDHYHFVLENIFDTFPKNRPRRGP